MKTFMLRIVSVGLLLAASSAWCGAAPAPPELSELATLEISGGSPGFSRISGLAFSPDSKILFATTIRNGIWLWDVASGKHIATLKHDPEHDSRLRGMILSPDGKTLFSKGYGSVWLWDVASRKHTATFEPELVKGKALTRMELSLDGKTAASVYGKTIVLWDVESRKPLGSLEEEGEVSWIMFSPDGKTLSTAVKTPRIPGQLIRREEWSPEILQIWSVEKKKRVRSYKISILGLVSGDRSLKKPVLAVLTYPGPDERRPVESVKTVSFTLVDAFTGDASLICEWDMKDGGLPQCFAVNRAETMVTSAGPNSPVQLWDRTSGKRIAIFKYPAAMGGLAFSPDSKILASCYLSYRGNFADGGLLLFALPSGKILADRKQSGGYSSLSFSPDGRLLATGNGREIKLWNIPERWRKDK